MAKGGDDFTRHALDQCVERHGFLPTQADTAAALRLIREGRTAMLRRQNDGEVYGVVLAGIAVRVVYCPGTDHVVTVLPSRPRAGGKALPRPMPDEDAIPRRHRRGQASHLLTRMAR